MVAGSRNANPLIFIPPIVLGLLILVGTLVGAILLKPGIESRMKKSLPVENLMLALEVESIDRQIRSKDAEILSEQQRPDHEKRMRDARRKLDETFGKRSPPEPAGSDFEQEKAASIKRLEDEKAQLAAKRELILTRIKDNHPSQRPWLERLDDYEVGLIIKALLPLGVLSVFFLRVLFLGRLSKVNPLSLTGFEMKSLLFLVTSIPVSAFGFFLFVWILSVTNNLWG